MLAIAAIRLDRLQAMKVFSNGDPRFSESAVLGSTNRYDLTGQQTFEEESVAGFRQ